MMITEKMANDAQQALSAIDKRKEELREFLKKNVLDPSFPDSRDIAFLEVFMKAVGNYYLPSVIALNDIVEAYKNQR